MTSPLAGDRGEEGGSYFRNRPLAGDGGEEEGGSTSGTVL